MHINISSIQSFKKEKKQYILPHYHNSIELIYVLDGCLHCLIQGKKYTINKDHLCIINQNHIHRIDYDKENNCDFRIIMIDSSFLESDKDIYNKYIEPVLLDEGFSQIILSSKSIFAKEIVNLIDSISELKRFKPDAYEIDIVVFLYMIFKKLYMLHKSTNREFSVPVDTDALLYRKIVDFIYKNYSKKLSLDDIANAGNISRSKCCILFKKYAQTSPINFLNLYRMEISTSLLRNTNDSISSIAFACGFGQQSYYNRLFLREYGMTPKEYRNN